MTFNSIGILKTQLKMILLTLQHEKITIPFGSLICYFLQE